MDSGRKRIPLGALSPSSARTGQRRRCSENDHSCLDAVENVDPNTTSGTGTTTFGCRDGFLTPSQRRLHGVDLSKVSTPAPGFQDRLGTQSPTRITQKGFIGSSQASVSSKLSGVIQKTLTPSQRRLRGVDLSGPSPPVFTSRLTNRSMNSSIKKTTFQLPASQITPKNTPQSSGNNVQLGRTVNLLNKHTYQGPHAIPMKTNKTASTSTSTNTPDSEITVLVPELDRISVRRPVWYQDQTKGSVANLLNSFNSVDEPSSSRGCKDTDHAEDDDADVQEEDEVNAEEEVPDRGHYTAQDESDSKTDNPDFWQGYMDLGPPTKVCSKCKSVMWNEERNNKRAKHSEPTFSLCCRDGQVALEPEKQPPPYLASLLSGGEKTSHFLNNIRAYNSMFQFTSLGGKIDKKINNGKGPYCFKLNGQNYHLLGTLMPKDGETPKFCQLYIYDTENEVQNRMNAVNGTEQLDPEIVQCLLEMLDEHNKCARGFRMARDRFKLDEPDEFSLQLLHSRSASGRTNHVIESNDVAALIVGEADDCSPFRDIVVQTKQMYLKRVFETCAQFMALQYPLLFPYGEEGFHVEIPLRNKPHKVPAHTSPDECPEESNHRTTVSMREYYAYKLMVRPNEGMTLHLGGRLWQQFVVDAFAAVEQYRLDWIKTHQHIIRSDLYRNIRDRLHRGDTESATVGQNVILPATFTGSQRYMNQYFKDSLAICRSIGHPSLFLTMTCNTQWPEIHEMLKHKPGVDVSNAPDIIARVFKLKLDQLIHLIKKKKFFGRCIGIMHVIEFQKRGLPHTHMLIWLHPNDRPKRIDQIDELISAEIPDENADPVGYHIVKNFMIHGPCGNDNMESSCMVKGKCIRHFPKRFNPTTHFDDCGFPQYRRRLQKNVVRRKGVDLDNQYVVPYNRELLTKFQCHINLEVCNSSRSLKYLFKYCLKGHDTATMIMKKRQDNTASTSQNLKTKSGNEIKQYLDGRYVCAVEAAWRLFGFDIHYRFPAVERLPVHCPGEKNVTFNTKESLQNIADKASTKNSKLEGWFVANRTIPGAREISYMEFPRHFTWKADQGKWKQREKGQVVGRIIDIHTSAGETFFLRMLLMQNKGATSYKDLRTVDGRVYQTFKEACDALGLLRDDRQWHVALSENALSALPRQLRELFVYILTNNTVADPLRLWTEHWQSMSEDIIYNRRRLTGNSSLQLADSEIHNWSLAEIDKLLNDVGKSLKDFPTLPYPEESYLSNSQNRLIAEETNYDKEEMKREHDQLFANLNEDQLAAYNSITDSIDNGKGGMYFVYGSGGCGKTFLWKTLCCRLRSQGKIVLPVASSGIAATLLPGGRTAHSRFHIPLKLDHISVAGIKHGTDLAELMKKTDLIIWDEAPMQHRHAFESVDRGTASETLCPQLIPRDLDVHLEALLSFLEGISDRYCQLFEKLPEHRLCQPH